MNIPTLLKRIAVAVCALALPIAHADEPPIKITANIRTIGNFAQPLPLWWMSGETPQEITVYPRELSRKSLYHGPPALAFYAKGANGAAPASGTPPVAQCVLPPKSGDYLLIFTANPGGATYKVVAVPEDIRGFKEGMFLFLNLSSVRILGAIENSRFSVVPGKTALMVFPSNPNGEIGLLLKMASVDKNEQWKVIYQRPQFYRTGCRWWCFLFDNPKTPEGVEARIFRDKLPIPPGQVIAPNTPPPPPNEIFNGPQDNLPVID